MIRVRVDLVPFGNEDKAKQIAEMVIANDGTGTHLIGNYGYVWNDGRFSGDGALIGFNRDDGIWELIYKCLGSSETHNDESFIDLLKKRLG